MQTNIKPYPGRFIHGINLGDWYPCWNISLAGYLLSPDFAALNDPGLAAVHQSLRDTPIHVLRNSGVPQGVPTPRALWNVWASAWVRRGGKVGIGIDNTQWKPQEELDYYLKIGDIELAFEEVRRTVLPDGASRLASLYVAEESEAGREHVRKMLGRNIHIIKVTVPAAIRVTKVDTRWFDEYYLEPKLEFIQHYWSGDAFDENGPKWEILVDGMIKVDDPDGLAFLKEHGAHRLFGVKHN